MFCEGVGIWVGVDQRQFCLESRRLVSSELSHEMRDDRVGSIAHFIRGFLNSRSSAFRDLRIVAKRERDCVLRVA